MRLAELYGARVVNPDGKRLGRLLEIHCRNNEVSWLELGAWALLHRARGRRRGRKIPWEKVVAIRGGTIIVDHPG